MSIEAARLSVVVDADTSKAEGGLSRMGNVVGGAGRTLGQAATGAAILTTAVGGLTVASTVSVDDALTPMGTLLGRNTEAYAELSGEVKNFIANSAFNADDIGVTAYNTLSAGVSGTADVMSTLTESQKLATAGLGDLTGANDLITSSMNSFAQEGLDAEKAAQILFGTIKFGKTNVDQMAQGFGGIAPLASAAGVSFNDLMAATAALTSTGAPASQAYSGLKGAISAVIKPSAEAAEMAESLGLNFNQAHLAAVGLPQFLDEIKEATGGNVETMGKLFGGVEGLNTVLSLTGPQADAFGAALTGVGEAGEELDDRAAEVNSNLSNTFARMKNRVLISLNAVGERAVKWLMPQFAKVEQWVKDNWPRISQVAQEVFGRVEATMQSVVQWVTANWPTISRIANEVFGMVSQAVAYFSDEVMPRIVTAVGAVVDWVAGHWPQISESIGEVMATVQEVVTGVLEAVDLIWKEHGEEIMRFVEITFDTVKTIVDTVMKAVRALLDVVLGLLKGDWERVWSGIKDFVGTIFEGMKKLIKLAIDAIAATLRLVWEQIKITIGEQATAAKDAVVEQFNKAKNFITGLPGEMKSAALSVGEAILGGIKDGVGSLKTWAGDQLLQMKDKISGFAARVKIAAKSVGQAFLDGLKDGMKAATGFASGIANGVVRAVKDAWNTVARKINDFLPNSIGVGPFSMSFDANPIPTFHTGGVVAGSNGQEVLALLQAGETVRTTGQEAALQRNVARPVASAGIRQITNIYQVTVQATPGVDAAKFGREFMAGAAAYNKRNGDAFELADRAVA